MGGLLPLVERGGDLAGLQASPRCTACNMLTHQRPVYQSLYCSITVRCSAALMCPLKVKYTLIIINVCLTNAWMDVDQT